MKAYEKLKFYQNICKLRVMIYKITQRFARNHPKQVGQTRDAIRSAKQNIGEGYDKDSLGEFLHSVKISRGSLTEAEGDIDDYYEDKLVYSDEYKVLKPLFTQTNYQMGRYMDSLIKLGKQGKWKQRWSLSNQRAKRASVTKCNHFSNRNVTVSNCSCGEPSNHIKGTALILTIFLITAVSGIALSIGRIMASEVKQTNRLEDSMVAYHTAEAGIEQGLLMWRYDHDVETSANATASSGNPLRFDLTDQGVLTYSLASPTNAKHQVYDLKVYYKGDKLGTMQAGVPTIDSPKLYKDQTDEYDVTNLAGKNLRVDWNVSYDNPPYIPQVGDPSRAQVSVEYQLLQTDNEWEVSLVEGVGGKRLSSTEESSFINISIPTDNVIEYTLRLRSFIGSSRSGPPWYPAEYSDQLKAAKPYINYAITNNAPDPIDSGYTIIESTGYYGGSKQKLQIKIDRNSGAILGSYDQLIYTQQLSNP